jgi:hypothetical protein
MTDYHELDRKYAAESRSSIDTLLRQSGVAALAATDPGENVEAALQGFAAGLNGASPLRRELARQMLRKCLDAAGFPAPARLAGLALVSPRGAIPSERAPAPDPDALFAAGQSVLDAPDQLALLRSELHALGYAGDTATVELLYVTFGSRLLERPINAVVEGPSAAGKSYTVDVAQAFHPPEAVHDLIGTSERALVYSEFETRHTYLVISEASALHRDGIGASIVRELAWGKGLRYETVEKAEDGRLVARMIERPGPTGLITTATKPLDHELATRLLRMQISDAPEQTRAVVRALALKAEASRASTTDLSRWHAAHRWLAAAGVPEVVVPYARALGERVPVDDVRMRRDFEQILSVVRAHALLHQRLRARDDGGRVVASPADYAAAHRLLANVMPVTLDAVSDAVRETVAAVERLYADRPEPGVSYVALGAALGVSREGARQRVRPILRVGFLANAEARKGYPAKLVLGDPLPQGRPFLPRPQELFPDTPLNTPCDLDASAQPATALGERTVKPPSKEPEASSAAPNQPDGGIDGRNAKPDSEMRDGVKVSTPNPAGNITNGAGDGLKRRPGHAALDMCPTCGCERQRLRDGARCCPLCHPDTGGIGWADRTAVAVALYAYLRASGVDLEPTNDGVHIQLDVRASKLSAPVAETAVRQFEFELLALLRPERDL